MGFYHKVRGCHNGQICTNCTQEIKGNETKPIHCKCENPPFFQTVRYGDRCDAAKICADGECFRPCETYLHITQCPTPRCHWFTGDSPIFSEGTCKDAPDPAQPLMWSSVVHG